MTDSGPGGGDPQRRVLDDVGSDSGFLAFVEVSNADLVFLGPALAVAIVVLELIVIATGRFFVGVGVSLLVLGVAAAYVFVCPDHRTPFDLFWSFIGHYRHTTTMTLSDMHTDAQADTETDPSADGRELTGVRTVEPEVDAIRRRDETLVGGVRIEPANLALAADDEWERAARGLGDVLNALAFPMQIHSSARRIGPERLTAVYEDRRNDPDVQTTPILEDIVEVYRRRRPQEFRERGTSIRRYYALVPVDVQAVGLEDNPWVDRLESVPLIGDHCASLLADWLLRDDRQAVLEQRQREILADRRQRLTHQLGSIEGVDVQPLSAAGLVELVEEYWTGTRTEYPDTGPHLRTTPVVMGTDDNDGPDRAPAATDEAYRSPIDADPSSPTEDR